MLRTILLGAAGILPALALLPARAAEPLPDPSPARIEPITLAEAADAADAAGEYVIGPIAQQAQPLPSELQPGLTQENEPAAASEPEPAPSPWAGTLELYGFSPLRATTSTTIRGFTAETDVGLGTILEHLTDIFFLRGSVEYNRIGFQTDLSYVGLAGENSRRFDRARERFPNLPPGRRVARAKVSSTQGIYDFALRYRFGAREQPIGTPGSVTVIPYAGVRVVDLGLDINTSFEGPLVQRSRRFSFGDPLAQPLIGLQGQVFVAPRLRLFARGDLGGFGANGDVDMSGNAQVGVGYAIGNSTQLDLSWRYLYLAYDNGETPNSAYTIDQNGIEMGVKFFF